MSIHSAATHYQVGACIEQTFVYNEIFLFPTQSWGDMSNVFIKIIAYINSSFV